METTEKPSFVAEATSPEPIRLYLSQTGIERSSFGSFDWLGWELVVNKLSPTGDELVFRDHWEETLLEILRHVEDYSDEPVQWLRESTGETADLIALQPAYDASRRFETAIKTVVSPDGAQRLCFNLYDDGGYRFTKEELIRDATLFAWVPRGWSAEHPDLPNAERDAREAYDWVD